MVAALGLEPVVKQYFPGDPVKIVMLAGLSFCIAAVAMLAVGEKSAMVAEAKAGKGRASLA